MHKVEMLLSRDFTCIGHSLNGQYCFTETDVGGGVLCLFATRSPNRVDVHLPLQNTRMVLTERHIRLEQWLPLHLLVLPCCL